MKTFVHSGDRGDCVAFLPVIRHMGGGVIYLRSMPWTREQLTPENWCGLDVLFKRQPYIIDVLQWKNERCDVNGDDFRAHMHRALRNGRHKEKALWDWMLEAHNCPLEAAHKPWLEVEPYNPGFKYVVFSRSGAGRPPQYQYHNPAFPWRLVWDKYHKHALFVGMKNEYENFCASVGSLRWMPTKDLDEAASVIAGCSLFVGNQSICHMIAEALKKPILLEVWMSGPNCLSYRPGVVHGRDWSVQLPEINI